MFSLFNLYKHSLNKKKFTKFNTGKHLKINKTVSPNLYFISSSFSNYNSHILKLLSNNYISNNYISNNYISNNYISNNYISNFFKVQLIKPNKHFKYLLESSILFLHRHLLKNSNKLLGVYSVNKTYLFNNNIFFPSFSTLKTFNKTLYYKKKNPLKNSFQNILFYYLIFIKKKSNKNNLKSNLLNYLNLLKKNFSFFKKSLSLKDGINKFNIRLFKEVFNNYSVINKNITSFYKLNKSVFIKKFDIISIKSVNKSVKFGFSNNNKTYNKSNTFIKKYNNNKSFSLFFKKNKNLLFFFNNSLLIKNIYLMNNFINISKVNIITSSNNNLIPNFKYFNIKLKKWLHSTNSSIFFKENLIPWVYTNFIRFIEFISGKRALLSLYSFLNEFMPTDYIALYKRWIERLSFYEKRLGHRFFLEEALHIIHISFKNHDVNLIINWLKAIIKRISFWKTRSIFRFLKYLFNNYFIYIFDLLDIKGFKVKLKGKISVAGNSRKRSIVYRARKNSYATTKVKVLHKLSLITTFTGVLGLQIWIFY